VTENFNSFHAVSSIRTTQVHPHPQISSSAIKPLHMKRKIQHTVRIAAVMREASLHSVSPAPLHSPSSPTAWAPRHLSAELTPSRCEIMGIDEKSPFLPDVLHSGHLDVSFTEPHPILDGYQLLSPCLRAVGFLCRCSFCHLRCPNYPQLGISGCTSSHELRSVNATSKSFQVAES
jgi:hypothetical protein